MGVPLAPLDRIAVSIVIAARNAAANIPACIDSVRWAEEVIVADHGSTDDTAALASSAGARVLDAAIAPTIGAARNAAITAARNEWILVIDTDERATADLARAVAHAVAHGVAHGVALPTHNAFRVPRRNFFLGREVRHGGWENDRPVRLFRVRYRYDDRRVHEHVVTDGAVGQIEAPLLHYPYGSLDDYFEKLDRYSRWWAQDQWRRGRRTSATAVVFRPPARFVSMYIFRLGLLDGSRGVVLAALAAASVLAKYARLWAMQCES